MHLRIVVTSDGSNAIIRAEGYDLTGDGRPAVLNELTLTLKASTLQRIATVKGAVVELSTEQGGTNAHRVSKGNLG